MANRFVDTLKEIATVGKAKTGTYNKAKGKPAAKPQDDVARQLMERRKKKKFGEAPKVTGPLVKGSPKAGVHRRNIGTAARLRELEEEEP
jgi:hypothetical protein